MIYSHRHVLLRQWNPCVRHASRLRAALAIVAFLLPVAAPAQEMHPFSTDGCSLFPDRSQITHTDWCSCCLAHDLAYWRGGTFEERLQADRDLKNCVLSATGNLALADLMYAGVRAGGGPYFFTPYRWGYGWPFGRMYKSLSSSEEVQAASLRDEYLAGNPTLACQAKSR